jgi:hypothetical protein
MKKMIKHEIDNKRLKLLGSEDEKIIIFDFPIRQVIKFHDCFVVRLEPDVGQIYNENVFGISNEGKILWQIETMSHVYKDSPYTWLGQEGDIAKLSNWDGADLVIEPYTGRIIKKSYSR